VYSLHFWHGLSFEKLRKRNALGVGAILTGLTILSWAWASEVSGMAPALCARSACFCWPVNNNLTKKVSLGAAIWIASLKELAWLDYYRRRFLIFASVSHFPD
jgi:hypothetical protein